VTFSCDGKSRRNLLGSFAALVGGIAGAQSGWAKPVNRRSGKVDVEGLGIYYEIHGGAFKRDVVPIVLLHGGATTIETAFAKQFVALLALTRPVIAIEQQAHGHTGDRRGKISLDRMIEDTAAVVRYLGVQRTDLFGHSLGGMIATGMAIRHPTLVRSITVLGAPYHLDGFLPDLVRIQKDSTLAPSPALMALLPTESDFAAWRASFERSAPDPTAFDESLARLNSMLTEWAGWSDSELRSIRAASLIVIGDRDFVRIDHAAEMVRLIPNSQLAVLPGTTHLHIVNRYAWLMPMMAALLRTPAIA
jgi:pimeloyl-ACP methyl ester carboxylesterase